MKTKPRQIVFVHPDLGIGGAERLIIDAAVGLQSLGHKVTILTSYCNKAHCFEEARDGTLDVRVRGDSMFPASIRGRMSILFSILRQLALVVSTSIFSSELRQIEPDVFFVDQLSACIPFFRFLFPNAKVLFYGHYPDRLLAKEESGARKQLKRIYRLPFDALEEWSTGCADTIVVNSNFTRNVFRKTFPKMRSRDLKVVYPCVDTLASDLPGATSPVFPGKKLLLSINRFEEKKNLDLAIKAFARLSQAEQNQARLVIAGGYDPRNHENAAYHKHLQGFADSLNLTHATYQSNESLTADFASERHNVLFLLSIPTAVKQRLLHSASMLIYTPSNEHFGIVPIEAMLAGVPVLATNTGGPLETIYDGRTGWLRSPEKVDAWTDVLRKPLIPSSADQLQAMGQRGRERVLAEFSQTKMTAALDREIQRLTGDASSSRPPIMSVYVVLFFAVMLLALVGGIIGLKLTLGS